MDPLAEMLKELGMSDTSRASAVITAVQMSRACLSYAVLCVIQLYLERRCSYIGVKLLR